MRNATIVAVSSVTEEGLRGVIRISGPASFSVISQFTRTNIKPQKHKWKKCTLDIVDWDSSVTAILYLMKAPFSYTSEDVVEIHTYSSPVLLDVIVKQCLNAGCEPAEPGEFTKRAFLSGKMDLAQAESVAEIIAAKTEAERKSAFLGMTGELSKKIESMQKSLLHIVALLEAHIDFSDEEIDPLSTSYIVKYLKPLLKELHVFGKKNKEIPTRGIQICICGAPNAGKSTLFNILTEKASSIVSSVSGTTLDWVEEQVKIENAIFNIMDTPGIEEKSIGIQKRAQEKAILILENCDLVLFVIDSSIAYQDMYNDLFNSISKTTPIAIIYNKIDLPQKLQEEDFAKKSEIVIKTSLQQGESKLKDLKYWLVEQAKKIQENKNVMLLNTRQYHTVEKTKVVIERAIEDIENDVSYEFIVGDLRLSLDYLGQIAGKVTTEDILGEIFSKFCIGK